MENKKLVAVLQRDMNELEELIADIKSRQVYDALEMEFIHTRAKGIIQLIRLLNVSDNSHVGNELPLNDEKIDQLKEAVSEIREEVIEQNNEPVNAAEKENLTREVPVKKDPVEEHPDQEFTPEKEVEPVRDEKALNNIKPREVNESVAEKPVVQNEVSEIEGVDLPDEEEEDDNMLDDEPAHVDSGSRLGDSFLKGKSIGDMVTDHNKLEFKLSNRPVTSIKSSIGINDRFQYIRELFDGNTNKFNETVNSLDSMDNIKEAVHYLRQNFKWKKNETSLKFVNLVKRRFQ